MDPKRLTESQDTEGEVQRTYSTSVMTNQKTVRLVQRVEKECLLQLFNIKLHSNVGFEFVPTRMVQKAPNLESNTKYYQPSLVAPEEGHRNRTPPQMEGHTSTQPAQDPGR